jgi:hypothetical protein
MGDAEVAELVEAVVPLDADLVLAVLEVTDPVVAGTRAKDEDILPALGEIPRHLPAEFWYI